MSNDYASEFRVDLLEERIRRLEKETMADRLNRLKSQSRFVNGVVFVSFIGSLLFYAYVKHLQ